MQRCEGRTEPHRRLGVAASHLGTISRDGQQVEAHVTSSSSPMPLIQAQVTYSSPEIITYTSLGIDI